MCQVRRTEPWLLQTQLSVHGPFADTGKLTLGLKVLSKQKNGISIGKVPGQTDVFFSVLFFVCLFLILASKKKKSPCSQFDSVPSVLPHHHHSWMTRATRRPPIIELSATYSTYLQISHHSKATGAPGTVGGFSRIARARWWHWMDIRLVIHRARVESLP